MVNVVWSGSASSGLPRKLVDQLKTELGSVFSNATQVLVTERFAGFADDPSTWARKIVAGIDVSLADGRFETHIIKVGKRNAVEADYAGWRACIAGRGVRSRILVPVEKHDLPENRCAIVYQDAISFFDDRKPRTEPPTLELVARNCVTTGRPTTESVERVLGQIYSDLERLLYRGARPNSNRATAFYRKRLSRQGPGGDLAVLSEWEADLRLKMRQTALWRLCGKDRPEEVSPADYLDPCDLLRWALAHRGVPATLVGPAHGDLHPRNVVVGVRRGEAEFPVVFDYEDMRPTNVVAWDLVKQEVELKVRMLEELLAQDPTIASRLLGPGIQSVDCQVRPGQQPDAALQHAAWLEAIDFWARFEGLLNALTDGIVVNTDLNLIRSADRESISGVEAVDRALRICYAIRCEAACVLARSGPDWRDEYYFALAVYGVGTAKWNYDDRQTLCALISAGMAAARIRSAEAVSDSQLQKLRQASLAALPPAADPQSSPFVSCRVPLAYIRHLWNAKDHAALRGARSLLDFAASRYAHAAPLVRHYALCLSTLGDPEEVKAATKAITPLAELAVLFGDHEVLMGIARIYKDEGDRTWSRDEAPPRRPLAARELRRKSAAWQAYRDALGFTLMAADAANASRHPEEYYPRAAAVGLALILQQSPGYDERRAEEIAEEVIALCRLRGPGKPDFFWVLVSEGHASLVLGDPAAANFYGQALEMQELERAAWVQSAFAEICRTWKALGEEASGRVGPVLEEFKQSRFRTLLEAGPLGNCNGQGPPW